MSWPTESNPMQHDAVQASQGLSLQVDFAWSKFQNQISEKHADHLEPLYIQHFRPTKPQLRFESLTDGSHTNVATGTIHNVSISADCTIRGRVIDLKPLKRWKTEYNYLSRAFSSDGDTDPVPVCWIANSSMKIWDFVCLNAKTQLPIAKFSINIWALKQVGNFYFEKPKDEISVEMRDEIVVTGLTLMYVMTTRMNNPLHLLGAAIAKPGRVDESEHTAEDVELAEHPGKMKVR